MNLESAYELFDHLRDGVCLSDANGDVLYMNQAAERLLALPRGGHQLKNACDLLCKNLKLASGKDAKCDCALRESSSVPSVAFQGKFGASPTYNWRDDRVSRSQTWRDLRVRCLRVWMPLDQKECEELHLVLIEDASADAELRRHREDWRSMIAHDLRQPLSAVFSALKLLEEIHPKARPDAQEQDSVLVSTAMRSCGRMMELLDLYLDVARIDAGSWPVKLERVDVDKALHDVVDEQAARASEAGVTIELDSPRGVSAVADVELLGRVFSNLLDNAVKYNVPGGSVKIEARRGLDAVHVAFKDTGRGIDAAALPYIFDRYYQAAARRAGRIHGNGLGLTFVQEALKTMGGSVAVESKPGKGSTFVVALKAAVPPPATGAKP